MGHRENLLDGAKRCLAEKGYANTTARDIVAASGANLASIGYHYGSTQALMNAAMLSSLGDWGEVVSAALAADGEESGDPLVRFWHRVLGTVAADRSLFMASVEAMVQAEHQPELRAQLAAGIEEGRSGLAALLIGKPEDSLDAETIRSVGSVASALMSGVLIQWHADPDRAPSAEQIAAGMRALAGL